MIALIIYNNEEMKKGVRSVYVVTVAVVIVVVIK